MSLVTSKEMLVRARNDGYAVPALNVENMEMVQACVWAAEEARSPLILQTTPGTLGFASLDVFVGMVTPLAQKASVPVAVHLDHGDSFDLAATATRAGYTSIMYDGSRLDYADNVADSVAVVRMCHAMGLPVELELGTVGGKEDSLESVSITYTDPSSAREFVEATGADSLAVAIGTSHGFYKGTPKLDYERLKQIAEVVPVPLVLHGSSGLTDEAIARSIPHGIAKVNFATELRAAYTNSVREFLNENLTASDPKKFNAAGRAAVQRMALSRIRVLGSGGHA